MSVAAPVEQVTEAEALLAERELIRRRAKKHPAALLRHVVCVDAKSGEKFRFDIDDEKGWGWQLEVLDWWLLNLRTIILKARQLGITWLACGLALWIILTQPGTTVLAVSIKQPDAIKLICRVWDMYLSLPEWLQFGVKVLKPAKGHRPTEKIELQHPDGRISTMLALPSSATAGHGDTAALVILDEEARQEYAADTWKAVIPTGADVSETAQPRIIVISTADGTGSNHFYHLWTNSVFYGLAQKFLGWRSHPGRGDDFLDSLPLSAADKREQYPDTAEEAFLVSGDRFFDVDALDYYAKQKIRKPVTTGRFTLKPGSLAIAQWNEDKRGAEPSDPGNVIQIYEFPEAGHDYALACDPSTGTSTDNSAAHVIDLSTMGLVAQLWGRMDEDVLATQLHYLGRYYNTALIAVERQGGYGNVVITLLRDGKRGRPPYRRMYRFREESTVDLKERKNYGYPVTQETRPLLLNGLEVSLREHALPWMTVELMRELNTFVYTSTRPSPRAQDGSNDDLVFSAAGALDMYRRFGVTPSRPRRTGARKPKKKRYPWDPDPKPKQRRRPKRRP